MLRALAVVVLLVPSAFAQNSRDGELLLSDHACTRCHQATSEVDERLSPKVAPRLGAVGARVTPQYLRKYLLDPHGTKPGTTMPDVLANVADDARRTRAVEGLVHYLVSLGGPIDQGPVVVSPSSLERGRQLFHEVGCVGCHAPKEQAWELKYPYWELSKISDEEREFHAQAGDPFVQPGTLPPPDVPFPDLAMKTTVSALTQFLMNPLHVRPSGRMPSLALSEADAMALSYYLLKEQQGTKREAVSGLSYEYYEYKNDSAEPRMDGLEPKRTGSIYDLGKLPKHRGNEFGFRYTGFVEIPEDGSWTFFTRSDDGSRLYIDGKLVVKNDGSHPMIEKSGDLELTAGRHAIEVRMFEGSGGEGLEVRWESSECGVKKGVIPASSLSHESLAYRPLGAEELTPDARQTEVGKMLFGMVGCTSCHTLDEKAIDLKPTLKAPALETLAGKSGGCLSAKPDGKSPSVELTDAERKALVAVLGEPAALAKPRSAAEQVDATMHRFNCYSCHRRSGTGGTHPLRKEYFKLLEVVDVDESGRLPPDLSGVGRKLHKEWLRATLVDGKRVHQHMAARMPDFGRVNVEHLVDAFHEADPQTAAVPEPKFAMARAELGRKLVGIDGGLGCIRCHQFCGEDSLGIPAVDLAPMTQRLRWPWFKDLMLDPNAVNMDTRMPQFWDKGKSTAAGILDGDPEAQIEAMWTYLTLGSSMPIPDGLKAKPGTYDLMPGTAPVQIGVFMRGVSPRTVVIGHKERIHFAFDVQNSRLAKAWRGQFFNAKGTWHARAGALESPASNDVIDMPPGAAFAFLDNPDASWPTESGADLGYRVLGRVLGEDRIPRFRYRLGDCVIEERSEPILSDRGGGMRRRFRVTTDKVTSPLWLRAAVGDSAVLKDGEWKVAGKPGRVLRFDDSVQPLMRKSENGEEVVVPLAPAPGRPVEFAFEIWW